MPRVGRDLPFDIAALKCRWTVLAVPNAEQHILFNSAGKRLQLCVRGESVLRPVRLSTSAIIDPCLLQRRILLLRRLSSLVVEKTLVQSVYEPDPRSRRLALVLEALDGFLAAAPRRELACALYGSHRVNADWTDPRNHLRDWLRRSIHRGRALMQGGYLSFLK